MEFLCAAKEKKRSFRVFVAEGAPRFLLVASVCWKPKGLFLA